MVSDAATLNVQPVCSSPGRRSVLIQPNLKFLHELLGWEIEIRAIESSISNAEILQRYSWPSLCRDLVSVSTPN